MAVVASMGLMPGCGGEEDNGVTYADDVQPIFNRRCTTCHRPVSPINVDIQNPFNPERGLVFTNNAWKEGNPQSMTPERNVVPFEPENSFLMDKLTGDLPAEYAGERMPLKIDPLTPQELADVEQWVTDGAENSEFYRARVLPIFGVEQDAGLFFSGKCIFCHYAGSPNPLDLSDPFGPDGLVNVEATYRGDMVRVLPGNPDESLMVLKVRAQQSASDIGAQMPYSYNYLTATQVDVVRQWILEGARP